MDEINCSEQAMVTVANELTDVELIDSNITDNPQKDADEGSKPININELPDWPLLWDDARKVRKDLDEPDDKAVLKVLARILGVLGGQVVRGLVAQSQELYHGEGMLIPDASRKRTLGGIFFFLAKKQVEPQLWAEINPYGRKRLNSQAKELAHTKSNEPNTKPITQVNPFTEEELKKLKQEFWAQVKQSGNWEKGEATTVKITVVGRPGQIQQNSTYVMFTMESSKTPDLPKGLPELTAPTNYLLMVANKQWKKVEPALAANPEDIIIAEGHSTIVPTFRGIAVLVKSITTKEQQKQLKLSNQEKANTINLAP